MPKTIQDIKEFIEISKHATECRIKRKKEAVKLKLRTKKALYVLKIEPNEAEEVIKKINCQIIEM
ncbi:MAG: hypothetical protein HWN67_04085 [Candidatus Helarchaeota archaeon]|nr:hypothetical protein [Candidatus Helarchaeota archaeon]